MFENLSARLQDVFGNLRNRGRLTEKDVDAALREVRMALLEADVNFKVARDFTARVRERAVGEEVMKSLTPAQQSSRSSCPSSLNLWEARRQRSVLRPVLRQ